MVRLFSLEEPTCRVHASATADLRHYRHEIASPAGAECALRNMRALVKTLQVLLDKGAQIYNCGNLDANSIFHIVCPACGRSLTPHGETIEGAVARALSAMLCGLCDSFWIPEQTQFSLKSK